MIEMSEATDIEKADMISPFLAAMVDRFSEIDNIDPTELFCKYIDIVNTGFLVYRSANWPPNNIIGLKTLLRVFKRCTKRSFKIHQHFNFCTTKFHALDHLANTISQTESVGCLN